MDDVKLALLGDRAAQERLTAEGVLLPCPGCKGEEMMPHSRMMCVEIECPCGFVAAGEDLKSARRIWNTRAAILTPEQLAALERMEEMK